MSDATPRLPTVALVGLGLIGRPAARRLAAAGFPLRCWNRSTLAPDLAAGLPVVATLEEALAGADVLVLLLSDTVATCALLERLEPLLATLASGAVVLDMGSSDPDDSRRHAEALAARGIGWVDAPISGGPEKTVTGELAIMAGGSDEAVAKVWPVLDELAGNISHVGGPSAGHTMKIINQVIVGVSIQTVAEGIALAEAAGFSVAEVQAATRGGNADNAQLRVMAPRMGASFYDPPGAKVKTMAKDLRLALRLAREHGLELPQLEIALARYEQLEAGGRADQDVSSLIELLRKPAAPGSAS